MEILNHTSYRQNFTLLQGKLIKSTYPQQIYRFLPVSLLLLAFSFLSTRYIPNSKCANGSDLIFDALNRKNEWNFLYWKCLVSP